MRGLYLPAYSFCVVLLVLFSITTAQAQNGKLSGIVRDESNETLPGVTVRAEELNAGTVTQIDGSFSIDLKEGSYTIIFNYVGFETKKITGVEIKKDAVTDLNITLAQGKKGKLQDVVVTATFNKASVEGLYNRQKNSASISDGISADQIKKTPDNNTAQVLKRVTGLTIQDNKFVTVRGMSERYNNVLLNNSSLPSTEPNRRNFSFDIIPSNLIDNVVVNKTATPDMSGEFAGGVVQVQTKDIPDDNYISVSLGSGYNTLSAGKGFQSLKRSNSEFFMKAPDNRKWWHGKWDDKAYESYINANDYQKITEYDKKIPNTWGLYEYKYNPMQQYQVAVGRVRKLEKGATIGLVGAMTFRHDEYRTREESRFRISDYALAGEMYELNSTGAGILNLSYQSKNSKLSFKNLYNNKYSHGTQVLYGAVLGQSDSASSYTDIITSSILYQNKLEGEHILPFGNKIKVGWALDRSQLVRSQPDMRNSFMEKGFYGLSEAQGSFGLSPGLSVMNAYLKEVRYNYSAYLSFPFTLFGQEQKLKAGYQGTRREADYTFNGFKMRYTPNTTVFEETYTRPDYFLADERFIHTTGLYFAPAGPSTSKAPESYTGEQNLHAAYAMGDLKLTSWLRFIGGVRVEMNSMSVNTATISFNSNDELVIKNETKKYDATDVLPSFNLVASTSGKTNVRFAYSKTLARPDFRERSSFTYFDFYDFTQYIGVGGLKDTRTDNVDLRLEYYPKPGEVLSVSLFYKKFVNPVELIQYVSSGSNSSVNIYFNLDKSENIGIEGEWRKSLGFISGDQGFFRNMFLSGNFSLIKSEVHYDIGKLLAAASGLNPDSFASSNQTQNRPPQGLSPYIINGGLGYQGRVFGAQLSYNRFGPRISIGAPYAHQYQYEQSRDMLDLQLSVKAFKKKADIRLNISDILQQPFITYQNAGVTPDLQGEIAENNDPKGSGFNADKDAVRLKAFRGSNISLSISYQL